MNDKCVYITDAYDFNYMMDIMQKLASGKAVDIPLYDYVSNSR